jgi:hypothetical protein
MMPALTSEQRQEIVQKLLELRPHADGIRWALSSDYLPIPSHQRIGNPDIWLIVGARGMGKSTLYRTLVDGRGVSDLAGPLFSPKCTTVVQGWGANLATVPPEWVAGPEEAVGYWLQGFAVAASDAVAANTAQPVRRDANYARRTLLRSDREALLEKIFTWDRELTNRGFQGIVVYDALEGMKNWQELAAGLLAFWNDLGPRLRAFSPKIFLREDVRDRLAGRGTDFAKLGSRTISLTWSVLDIYRLLLFVFAKTGDTAREQLEWRGFAFTPPRGIGGPWLPPHVVPEEGDGSQDAFATLLAGKWMGTTAQKGLTARWIPRMLADGNGAMAPRTAINLLIGAAEAWTANPQEEGSLFSSEHLRAGLRFAAKGRAAELNEERRRPFSVEEFLVRLGGSFVPIDGADLALKLFVKDGALIELNGEEPSAILAEMQRIGVLTQRSDGRFDVPELYRLGFELKRRGGAALHARR